LFQVSIKIKLKQARRVHIFQLLCLLLMWWDSYLITTLCQLCVRVGKVSFLFADNLIVHVLCLHNSDGC